MRQEQYLLMNNTHKSYDVRPRKIISQSEITELMTSNNK